MCLRLSQQPDRPAHDLGAYADVIKTHQRIRDTIRTQPEFQELCTKTHTDAQCVEQWVENVLREKDGPSKVVKVVYTDGPALEFLDFMTMIGGLTTKGEQNACEPAPVVQT